MIDLNSPNLQIPDIQKILKKCLKSNWISTSGKMVTEFEKKISKFTGSKYVVACNSGTSALHIAIKLLNVKAGEEIIVPTLTFVATINAVLYNACKPIFMDCDDYYNIDTEKTEEFIKKNTIFLNGFTYNKKTKKKIAAVVLTHVWGNAVKIEKLISICKKRHIKIIEDASESLGSRYKKNKKHTGTHGLIGVLSFNSNKIITTSSGGAILTNNLKIAEKAKYLTTQAKDDPIYFVHDDVGYNYRMNNILASIGISQLKSIDKFIKSKKKIYKNYKVLFEKSKKYTLAKTPDYAFNNHWMNLVQIKKNFKKDIKKILSKLLEKKILARPVWKLNHTQRKFKYFEKYKISKAIELYNKSLCIPSSTSLSIKQQKKIFKILDE
tara:strand:+ start:3926 stop:5068 length:1143 start_codon:yes stop_codon:yes gene_type:complete